jgi:hypothetical protein
MLMSEKCDVERRSTAVFVVTAYPRRALITLVPSFGDKIEVMVGGVHHVDATLIG